MSRIYEALQKAEAERAAGGSREHDEPFHDHGYHHAATALAEHEPQPESGRVPYDASHAPAFPAALSPDAHFAHEELATRVPGLDLEAIVPAVWTPNFQALPAVLERGPGVEQFRSLRSRLYELQDAHKLKTLMITSGLPQEGKSFVSTNLAVSLARNKSARVLLIDGDMRRHTVHNALGCQRVPGLADLLAGRSSLQETVQLCDVVQSAGKRNGIPVRLPELAVIAGGEGGDDAADLSNNGRFDDLIRTAAPLFDWIIVDSSPVLPVSDAVNLSRSCDGVLLVVRSGVTQYDEAQRTQAELRNANVLGVVINGTQVDAGATYYGYSPTPTSTPAAPRTGGER